MRLSRDLEADNCFPNASPARARGLRPAHRRRGSRGHIMSDYR